MGGQVIIQILGLAGESIRIVYWEGRILLESTFLPGTEHTLSPANSLSEQHPACNPYFDVVLPDPLTPCGSQPADVRIPTVPILFGI